MSPFQKDFPYTYILSAFWILCNLSVEYVCNVISSIRFTLTHTHTHTHTSLSLTGYFLCNLQKEQAKFQLFMLFLQTVPFEWLFHNTDIITEILNNSNKFRGHMKIIFNLEYHCFKRRKNSHRAKNIL